MATTKVQAEHIAVNAISGTIIADNAITAVHIAQNAVTAVQIPDASITTTQLAADAVTGAKLADSSVVTANIQDDQVTGDKLADNITIAGTLGVTGIISPTTHVDMPDNAIIKIGTGDDLELKHTGSNSVLHNKTGQLRVRADSLAIQSYSNEDNYIVAAADGAVTLYYDNAAKLATNSGGVTVTGTAILGGASFVDSATAYFGTGTDLRIYHDGSNSKIETGSSSAGDFYIAAQGTNHDLYLRADDDIKIQPQGGEDGITLVGNGAVTLYYDNAAKLATASGGVTVTGALTADSITVGNSNIGSNTSHLANLTINNNSYIGSVGNTSAIKIATSGAVTMGYADLTITADNARLLVEEADGTNIAWVGDHTGDGHGGLLLYNHGGTATVKLTADSHANYINNGNNFGIGTVSPEQPLTVKANGAVAYNGATDLDGESFMKFEGTSADGEAAMIRWANHGSMNNYFGVTQVGASGQGDFVWTSYGGGAYAERMRITSAGLVGIADNGPAYMLDINASSTASAFRIASGGNGKDVNCTITNGGTSSTDDTLFDLTTAGGAGDPKVRWSISGNENYEMGIDNSDSDRLKISQGTALGTSDIAVFTGGRMYVGGYGGPTWPGILVAEKDQAGVPMLTVRAHNADAIGATFHVNSQASGNNSIISCWNNSQDSSTADQQFRVRNDGTCFTNNGSTSSLSDRRLKKNIVDYTYDLSKFKSLRTRKFDWENKELHGNKDDVIGFIAQEVDAVDSRWVIQDQLHADSKDVPLVDADLLTFATPLSETDAMYVSVIQQLITRLETAEAKIAVLEG